MKLMEDWFYSFKFIEMKYFENLDLKDIGKNEIRW